MKQFFFLLCALILWLPSALAAVDINAAGQSELETLPGIGASKANAIIEFRTQNGPFTNIEQLDDVPGIGPSTMANLRPLVTLGEGAPAAEAGSDAPTGETAAPAPAESTASTTPAGDRVNVNTATATELDALPGIGPSKAAAIVADRTANGPFTSCADLTRVKGIGDATAATIADLCTTGEQ